MIYYSVVDISINNGQGVYGRKTLEQAAKSHQKLIAIIPEPADKKAILTLLEDTRIEYHFLPKKTKNRAIIWHIKVQLLTILAFIKYRTHRKVIYSVKPMMFGIMICQSLFKFKTLVLVEGYIPASIKRLGIDGFINLPLRIVQRNILKGDLIIPAYHKANRWVSELTQPQNIKLVHCGVDYEKVQPCKKTTDYSHERLTIGYIGSFRDIHCLEMLIQIANQFDFVDLCLIGHGKEYNRIRDICSATFGKGVEKRVSFLGNRQHEDLSFLVSSCNLMWGITDEKNHGVPIKVYEYLAMNKNIIAKFCEDFKFIKDENLGILINDVSIENITSFILKYHEKEITLNGEKLGRNTVQKYSNWDNFGNVIKAWQK